MNKASKILGIILLPFLVFFAFFFMADGFGFHTIPIIISQSMIPTVLGLAMACIMPAGLMDFSPGARLIIAAVVGGLFAQVLGIPGLLIGCLIGGIMGGVLLALLYRYLKIPSMVVSLGLVLVLEALADRIATSIGGGSAVMLPKGIAFIGNYPSNIIITLIACAIYYYCSYKTKLGCLINAIGNDEAMLKNMGVRVDQVKFKAFILSGFFCFVAGILQICYSGSVAALTGMATMSMVFKPMMGVLIAMQLIKIYDNMPLMIFVGEIVIQTVFNGFIAMGWTDNIQNIALGFFLLVVLGVSENTERFAEYSRKRSVRRAAAQAN